MQKITIVQLSGKMGSGKTTLARALLPQFAPTPTKHMKFADPLYEMHEECLGVMSEYGVHVPEKDGKLLQVLGTEWARATYGEDIWRNILLSRIEDYTTTNPTTDFVFLIDDLRFRNEVLDEAVKIRLTAPEIVRRDRAQGWRENTKHRSETDLDDYSGWDLILDTHLDSVEDNVKKVMDFLGSPSQITKD